MTSMIPCGDFKTGYSADTTIFPTPTSRNMVIFGIAVLCLAPLVLDNYALSLLIQIGYLGIAALGLNILVGLHRADLHRPRRLLRLRRLRLGLAGRELRTSRSFFASRWPAS